MTVNMSMFPSDWHQRVWKACCPLPGRVRTRVSGLNRGAVSPCQTSSSWWKWSTTWWSNCFSQKCFRSIIVRACRSDLLEKCHLNSKRPRGVPVFCACSSANNVWENLLPWQKQKEVEMLEELAEEALESADVICLAMLPGAFRMYK